ncbi:MAG: methylated-DNA--[protein]-cysteine S-methyltransferase [Pseudomonadota bacterium]
MTLAPDLLYDWFESPAGRLLLAGDGTALHHLGFPSGSRASRSPHPGWTRDPAAVAGAARQLSAYFAGELAVFDLALAPHGTPFQKRVWALLAQIPYGETRSYGDLAKALDAPGASRAVGAANGANPIPIILPCHRVVGADGKLAGFGGGVPLKRALLALEGALPPGAAPDAQPRLI